jgi:hypothetical protein
VMSSPEELPDEVVLQALKGWLSQPNVVGLSVGPKRVRGVASNRRAIIVHVARKVPSSALDDQAFAIPAEVEFDVPRRDGSVGTARLPTDVIEVGEPRPEALDQRVRPCPGGYQIMADNIGIKGTLGVSMVWRGKYRLLANNHVISENGHKNADVFQPSENVDNIVGNVDGFIPVVDYQNEKEPNPVYNHQDMAWSDVGKDLCAPEIYEIGAPKGWRPPKNGETVRLVGKATGKAVTAKIASVTLMLSYRWRVGGTDWAWFENLIQLDSKVTQAGDSGAAYVADDNMVVGLHMGSNNAYSFGCVVPD